MNRYLAGGLVAILLVAAGLFWWQGRAMVDPVVLAPPPPADADEAAEIASEPEIPSSDARGLRGPAPPQALESSAEQRRFNRYDRNFDRIISRNEMLSTRSNDFRRLDTDGNNLLTFEEWAVATSNRFRAADSNGDQGLTPQEFRATRPKQQAKPACKC